MPISWRFANLRKRNCGKALPPSKHYLDKIHLDTLYGHSIRRLGFRFALLLIDHATCVCPELFERADHAVGLLILEVVDPDVLSGVVDEEKCEGKT